MHVNYHFLDQSNITCSTFVTTTEASRDTLDATMIHTRKINFNYSS
jgi:hypothetical protein